MLQTAAPDSSRADTLDPVVRSVKARAQEAAEGTATLGERGTDALAELVGLGETLTQDLVYTAILIVVLWAVRQIVLSVVRRRTADDARKLYQWRKGTTYAATVVGILALIWIWTDAIGSISTFLGLLTAGVAIALKDPLVDLAGWAFLIWRRPFATGDRITIHGHTGDVIDQRLFQFTLLEVGTVTGAGQSTGRIVHLPNGWVFSDSVTNHTGTFAYVWHEVPVVVTFESDWRAAKQILLDVAHECADHLSEDAERTLRRAAREYFIFYSKLTPTVYTSVVGEGVQLTMRYLVAPRRVRGSEQDVWEAVLDRFAARDDVDLAYPTSRVFHNYVEGKPEAGGPKREPESEEAG
ncbi:mechanosensitive ion channel family protein [Rubrivirga marina]|uniref:mechanosensitive ion channel family protein n=1 Tax=Rubrivirga marina TaxID=1196024 RepID=UPI0015C830EB|nr:mechanosensitive ion channel family protein [Rubrivirga marina]